MEKISERILQFNHHFRPELAAIKYRSMAENAFRFFRGTCHIFYEDLVNAPALPYSPVSWICGDLHLENFGSYRGDNQLVYFDVNDFDEAMQGPILWDVVRISTSILLAFDLMKLNSRKAHQAVRTFLTSFNEVLARGKALYIESQTAEGIMKKFLVSAQNRKSKNALSEHTIFKKGKVSLLPVPKSIRLKGNLKKALLENFLEWARNNPALKNRYKVLDVTFRIAGTGSIGSERYLFLCQKIGDRNKYLLIDMKEARPSSLEPYLSLPRPSWDNEAQRVITVQQMMQNVSPALLNQCNYLDRSFVIQEMQPVKDRFNFQVIENDFRSVISILQDMGRISASTYLESSGRLGSATADALMAFASSSAWQDTIFTFSLMLAQKTKDDFDAFKSDYKMGIYR